MVLRVIVEVQGNEYRLVHAGHVDMLAPAQPIQLEGVAAPLEGEYAELRNDRDEPVYQHSLSSQLDASVEVFSSGGSARRVDAPDRKQTVMLMLPDQPDAESIVFMRAPSANDPESMTMEAAGAGPEELARFSLKTGDSR